MPARRPLRERFEEKWIGEPNSGCWLWLGASVPKGYGYIASGDGATSESAHRISWRLHCGDIPPGMCVLHRCDMPCCVNPDHLFLGTVQDNSTDMVSKGRGKRGKKYGRQKKPCEYRLVGSQSNGAKLTEDQVLEIKKATNPHGLAERFGVTKENIYVIRRGKTWKHVGRE